jgi:hypothetical protein
VISAAWLNDLSEDLSRLIIGAVKEEKAMAQKPFLALVIPAAESTGALPPGQAPGGPGQSPGLPPGQLPGIPHPSHPIVIEPPELPDLDVPEGSKLVLVWNGEDWQWALVSPGQPAQPIAPTPSPKR